MKTSARYMLAALLGAALVALAACGPAEEAYTEEMEGGAEAEAEWTTLFDGETFDGWHALGRDSIPSEHWQIEDGMLHKIASGDVPVQADGQPIDGGDLITDQAWENFEFVLEWKATPGANSGIKYNVSEEMSTANPPGTAALGFEFQILDDALHPDAQTERGPMRRAGALYDLIAPSEAAARPVGEWNEARIVFNGAHGEHWLNGVKVVEYDLDSDDFAAKLAESKYAPVEGFADKRRGHIVLQDHNDSVWFRNIRIRELTPDM